MPLTLVPPKAGRTPNYRIRGTYFGVYVDVSTRTADKRTAKRMLEEKMREIVRENFASY